MIAWASSILLIASPGSAYVNILYLVLTGKEYVENRVAFAEAACFDLAAWAPIAGFLMAFSVYWTTWRRPDPIYFLRSPAGFVGAYSIALLICLIVGSWLLFRLRRVSITASLTNHGTSGNRDSPCTPRVGVQAHSD